MLVIRRESKAGEIALRKPGKQSVLVQFEMRMSREGAKAAKERHSDLRHLRVLRGTPQSEAPPSNELEEIRIEPFSGRRKVLRMSNGDLIPVLLLLLFGAAFGAGVAMFYLVRWIAQREAQWTNVVGRPDDAAPERAFVVSPLRAFWRRPTCWLAIRGRNLLAVQAALQLDNPRPCSWSEGLSSDRQLFVSPPLHGWILVMGAGLPDPSDDVDECFRFLSELSRRVGHVQLFKADATLLHHAWARIEAGRVVRAYAWAGNTVWHQGMKTASESELGLKCFHYGEGPRADGWSSNELLGANVEKVPLLAARWSLNPAELDARLVERSRGVTGWPTRRI